MVNHRVCARVCSHVGLRVKLRRQTAANHQLAGVSRSANALASTALLTEMYRKRCYIEQEGTLEYAHHTVTHRHRHLSVWDLGKRPFTCKEVQSENCCLQIRDDNPCARSVRRNG